MFGSLAVLVLSTAAMAQSLPGQTPEREANRPAVPPAATTPLPPIPKGRSTVIGGEIRKVDPVRDQFTLKVFGGQSLQILFDERTQVYRDGVKIRVLDLHPEDHGSVETTLDGTKIFAIRIRVLSQPPQGDCRGEVSNYNPRTGELTVKEALSQEPITLHVPPGTPVERVGQDPSVAQGGGLSDLGRGSRVEVSFKAGLRGQGVVTKIGVLAAAGATFRFSGKLLFLDSHTGRLVIEDARDQQTHEISYDPSRFAVSRDLREGLDVRLTTIFDGTRYVASEIAME